MRNLCRDALYCPNKFEALCLPSSIPFYSHRHGTICQLYCDSDVTGKACVDEVGIVFYLNLKLIRHVVSPPLRKPIRLSFVYSLQVYCLQVLLSPLLHPRYVDFNPI